MKRIVYLLLTLIIFAVSVSAQNLTLEDALNRIPFSKIPYQERGLPIGHTDGCLVNRYDGIDGNMYEDLQCRESDLAKGYADFTPEVYLKIKLFDDLYLGALSFGGCTDYRTDVMFLCDANGHVSDTLLYPVATPSDELKEALGCIPFSKVPYQERYFLGGRNNLYGMDFNPMIEGRIYEDLQCKQYSLAEGNNDFMPTLYLKIPLSNGVGLCLGAVFFGGATDYRTDVIFVCDADGHVTDTLECCVLNGDLAVKQYTISSLEDIVVYQMIFDTPMPMK